MANFANLIKSTVGTFLDVYPVFLVCYLLISFIWSAVLYSSCNLQPQYSFEYIFALLMQ